MFGRKKGVSDGNRGTAGGDFHPDATTVADIVTSADGTDEGPGPDEGSDEGTYAGLVPLLGFKRAHLKWKPGGRWQILSGYGRVQRDALAHCLVRGYEPLPAKNHGHSIPVKDCTCGFHAVKDPNRTDGSYGMLPMDVELSGRIIVHELGYRAEHQRVLNIHRPVCWVCGVVAVGIGLEMTTIGPERPYCEEHDHWFGKVSLERVAESLQQDLPLSWGV